jgi:hypothetical protein
LKRRNNNIKWFPDLDINSMSITKQGHDFDGESSTELENMNLYEYNTTYP